jgi:hypothetical protein
MRVRASFYAKVPTSTHESLHPTFIVGSCPALGSWDPSAAKKVFDAGRECGIGPETVSYHTEFECEMDDSEKVDYKYLLGPERAWEVGENRVLDTGKADPSGLVLVIDYLHMPDTWRDSRRARRETDEVKPVAVVAKDGERGPQEDVGDAAAVDDAADVDDIVDEVEIEAACGIGANGTDASERVDQQGQEASSGANKSLLVDRLFKTIFK